MSLKYLLKDSDVFRHLVHKGRKALKPPTKLSHKQNERQTAGLRKEPTSPRHHEHHDDLSLPRSGHFCCLVQANFPRGTTNQKHGPYI